MTDFDELKQTKAHHWRGIIYRGASPLFLSTKKIKETMRQPDINRLARIVEHYEAIDRIFDSLQTSLEKQDSEFISINHISVSVYLLVSNMRKDANENREWIERKLKQIKEL